MSKEQREKVPNQGGAASGIGQRIRTARQLRRMSQAKLGRAVGVATQTVLRYETGGRGPPADFVEAAARALEADPNWLLTGEGRTPEGLDEMPPSSNESDDLPVVDDEEMAWITKYGAEPTAGPGGAVDDRKTGRYPLAADVARQLGHPRVKLGAVRVRGDSMEPSLRDGDYVVVASDPTAIDDICVIDVGGELLVKRVHRDLSTGGLLISSDNRNYPPQRLPPDASGVRVIGRVVKEDRVRKW